MFQKILLSKNYPKFYIQTRPTSPFIFLSFKVRVTFQSYVRSRRTFSFSSNVYARTILACSTPVKFLVPIKFPFRNRPNTFCAYKPIKHLLRKRKKCYLPQLLTYFLFGTRTTQDDETGHAFRSLFYRVLNVKFLQRRDPQLTNTFHGLNSSVTVSSSESLSSLEVLLALCVYETCRKKSKRTATRTFRTTR